VLTVSGTLGTVRVYNVRFVSFRSRTRRVSLSLNFGTPFSPRLTRHSYNQASPLCPAQQRFALLITIIGIMLNSL
jgi:hypothetical protein